MPLALTEVDHLILIEPAAAPCNLVKEILSKKDVKIRPIIQRQNKRCWDLA